MKKRNPPSIARGKQAGKLKRERRESVAPVILLTPVEARSGGLVAARNQGFATHPAAIIRSFDRQVAVLAERGKAVLAPRNRGEQRAMATEKAAQTHASSIQRSIAGRNWDASRIPALWQPGDSGGAIAR